MEAPGPSLRDGWKPTSPVVAVCVHEHTNGLEHRRDRPLQPGEVQCPGDGPLHRWTPWATPTGGASRGHPWRRPGPWCWRYRSRRLVSKRIKVGRLLARGRWFPGCRRERTPGGYRPARLSASCFQALSLACHATPVSGSGGSGAEVPVSASRSRAGWTKLSTVMLRAAAFAASRRKVSSGTVRWGMVSSIEGGSDHATTSKGIIHLDFPR
jgi:hypothetical protein